MKKCPVCNMIVDAESECPFCYTTITYEPKVLIEKEKYLFNKYFFLHLLKNSWFSFAGAIFVFITLLVSKPEINWYVFLTVFLSLYSLIISIFQRKFTRYITWKYSKDYAHFVAVQKKVFSCLLACIMCILFLFN